MGKVLLLMLVFAAGAMAPVQMAMNTKLDKSVGSPVVAALVSFLGGVLLLGALYAAGILGRGQIASLSAVPAWAYFTGPIGVFIVVVGLMALPRTSAALLVAAMVFGEGLASVLIDHFGWLDVKRVGVNAWRIVGLVLMFAGVLLIQKQK